MRLLTRVEGFVTFLIDYHQAVINNATVSADAGIKGALKDVRGLEVSHETVQVSPGL